MLQDKLELHSTFIAPFEQRSLIISQYTSAIRYDVRSEAIHVYTNPTVLNNIHKSFVKEFGQSIGELNPNIVREYAIIPIILVQKGQLNRHRVDNSDLKKVLNNALYKNHHHDLWDETSNRLDWLTNLVSIRALPVDANYRQVTGFPTVGVEVKPSGEINQYMNDNLMVFFI